VRARVRRSFSGTAVLVGEESFECVYGILQIGEVSETEQLED
jgi:hypothetical protein